MTANFTWGRPLLAGIYHVAIIRGMHWEHGGQDGGAGKAGASMVPSEPVLKDWILSGITGSCGGQYDLDLGLFNGG